MSAILEKIFNPLLVAGVVALVALLFRISMQMEGMRGEITAVKVEMQGEIVRNRAVTCTLARKQGVLVADCPL